jgi:hypothetical protein
LIDKRLDWLKEMASQHFFRLVFIPDLINFANFSTKPLPFYLSPYYFRTAFNTPLLIPVLSPTRLPPLRREPNAPANLTFF